ncbi:helix-turn-helix transcriptional regulator [Saccharothrix deserti]|uniref:helix-turn-helix transcriptional regulator n=1 Tax=Saccharothrix deserti TaxID=2593674 RepID=UPI00131E271C|nr:helix-turn-helix transcriptional regulator [Saccharothrix deserti]
MAENAHRHELAEFLRACRCRLEPERAGLPVHGRRRTPGLRREEVAALAGVSSTWYTRLEQGRNVQASHAVLESLARALQLSAVETAHLLLLGGFAGTVAVPATPGELDPAFRQLVDELEPSPAYVVDRYWDLQAFNASAADWFPGFRQAPARNLFLWVMTAPAAKQWLVDWAEEARSLLGQFRAMATRHPQDTRYQALLAEAIDADPAIGAWWSRHEVRAEAPSEKRVFHPTWGLRTVRRLALQVVGREDISVVVCLHGS